MIFSMRCPYCKERIRKGAVRCKHCHSSIGKNGKAADVDESIKYLQNGFSKIHAECDTIESRIKMRTGFVFVKHQYSNDDLLESAGRIESFVGKMQSDIEEWKAADKLDQQVMYLFTRKAEEVYERLQLLHAEIQQRGSTWWEAVCTTFKRIIEKLFALFSFKLIAGKKENKSIAA